MAPKDISKEAREKAASKGQAMPNEDSGGSFPIRNVDELKRAIQSIGRAKDPAKTKAHIKSQARALGHVDLIPENWSAVASLKDLLHLSHTHPDGHFMSRSKLQTHLQASHGRDTASTHDSSTMSMIQDHARMHSSDVSMMY